MDTSDSEYFESADEEIYEDGEDKQKCEKNIKETQSDLNNLNLVDSSNTLIETHKLNIDTSLNNVTITYEAPTQFVGEKDNLDKKVHNIEKINVQEEKVNEIGNKSAKLTDNKPTDIDNNTKRKETDTISNRTNQVAVKDNENSLGKKYNTEITSKVFVSCETKSIHLKQECDKVDESKKNSNFYTIKHSVDIDVNKEYIDDVINKKEKSQELSDNDDNMWENDDWVPVNYQEDPNKLDNKKDQNKQPSLKQEDENMWDNDEWEPFENAESQKAGKPTEPSWSSWGNWGGVSSILSSATQGVSTITTQVSQGLSTVLENSMGIPDPKELAKLDKEEESLLIQQNQDEPVKPGFGFGNLSNLVSGVSHITKFVEHTGSKVITGGLDTLETIGKKTMEVLQDGDPGLKNKRALLKLDQEKPILSQVLREAKEKAERENKVLQETHSKRKMNYETLFDDYHGLVHLEALEMLSKQCEIKLQTLCENCSGTEFQDLQETMDQIKELCELPDEDDDDIPTFDDIKDKLKSAVIDINVSITYDKLISIWNDAETWLNTLKLDFCGEDEIHQEALQVLAKLTAIAVEQFHKCGELLLIKEHRSTADEADSLVQLTMALTSLIGLAAGKFSEKLNMKSSQTGNKESINSLITNVFFEAGNSSSYIQDAFQLLISVLQVGAV